MFAAVGAASVHPAAEILAVEEGGEALLAALLDSRRGGGQRGTGHYRRDEQQL
jgi:hypothetical protein